MWQPARVLQCPCGKEQAQQACCHLPLAACVGFSIAWTAQSVSPNPAGYLACSLGAEGLYGPLSRAGLLQASQSWSLYGLGVSVDDPGIQGTILRSL